VLINYLQLRYFAESAPQLQEFYTLENTSGNTVAHLCVMKRRLDILEFVLEIVPDLATKVNATNLTPLQLLEQRAKNQNSNSFSFSEKEKDKEYQKKCKKLLKKYLKQKKKKKKN